MASGLVFAGGETSAVGVGTGTASSVDGTTASTFNAARSRGSIKATGTANGTVRPTATLTTALPTAAIHFVAYWGVDTDDNSGRFSLYDDNGIEFINFYGTSNGTSNYVRYWNGSTWTQIGQNISFVGSSYDTALVNVDILVTPGATGTFSMTLNGTNIVDNESIAWAGGASFKYIEFRREDDAGTSYYSEIAIGDGTERTYGWAVETEAPTADGTDTAGTGTFADVDDMPSDNGATFISLATAADQHSFTSPARTGSATGGIIKGVSVAASMSRDVTGPQNARFYLKIGGTRYYSSTFALTLGIEPYQYSWDQDPSTAADWVKATAEAAALEWGIEAVA